MEQGAKLNNEVIAVVLTTNCNFRKKARGKSMPQVSSMSQCAID
jgi:hypothetical protein